MSTVTPTSSAVAKESPLTMLSAKCLAALGLLIHNEEKGVVDESAIDAAISRTEQMTEFLRAQKKLLAGTKPQSTQGEVTSPLAAPAPKIGDLPGNDLIRNMDECQKQMKGNLDNETREVLETQLDQMVKLNRTMKKENVQAEIERMTNGLTEASILALTAPTRRPLPTPSTFTQYPMFDEMSSPSKVLNLNQANGPSTSSRAPVRTPTTGRRTQQKMESKKVVQPAPKSLKSNALNASRQSNESDRPIKRNRAIPSASQSENKKKRLDIGVEVENLDDVEMRQHLEDERLIDQARKILGLKTPSRKEKVSAGNEMKHPEAEKPVLEDSDKVANVEDVEMRQILEDKPRVIQARSIVEPDTSSRHEKESAGDEKEHPKAEKPVLEESNEHVDITEEMMDWEIPQFDEDPEQIDEMEESRGPAVKMSRTQREKLVEESEDKEFIVREDGLNHEDDNSAAAESDEVPQALDETLNGVDLQTTEPHANEELDDDMENPEIKKHVDEDLDSDVSIDDEDERPEEDDSEGDEDGNSNFKRISKNAESVHVDNEDPQIGSTSSEGGDDTAATCFICSKQEIIIEVGNLLCNTFGCTVRPTEGFYMFGTSKNRKQYCSKCCEKDKKLKKKVANLVMQLNVPEDSEEFYHCTRCSRKAHEFCLSVRDKAGNSDEDPKKKKSFKCKFCKGLDMENSTVPLKATDIPHTALSKEGERFLTGFEGLEGVPLFVRELNSSRSDFVMSNVCPKKYEKYFERFRGKKIVRRTIGVFQTVQRRDVLIAMFYMSEYEQMGEERWFLVDYVDSIRVYSEEEVEAYEKEKDEMEEPHEKAVNCSGIAAKAMLQFYFRYMKEHGFTHSHLWAKPAEQGNDYCFYIHPPHQRYLEKDALIGWYTKALSRMPYIEQFLTFEEKGIAIKKIADIKDLPAFENSLWSSMIDWAVFEATDDNKKNLVDKSFLEHLSGYVEKHMDDNFFIEFAENADKSEINQGLLRHVRAMENNLSGLGFFQRFGSGFHSIRTMHASTEAVIAEVMKSEMDQ